MTSEERKVIKDLKKCNFKEMHSHFMKVQLDCLSSSVNHYMLHMWNDLCGLRELPQEKTSRAQTKGFLISH